MCDTHDIGDRAAGIRQRTCDSGYRLLITRQGPGFTLLEIMVSLSILAIALLAVFRLQSQTLSMHGRVSFDVTAPFLAQEKLSQLEAKFPDPPESGSGDWGQDWPGFSWRTQVARIDAEELGDAADDVYRIDITVASTDDDQAYRLHTYRFAR